MRSPSVLATCGIRPSNEAFENTQSRLLLLADSEEEEYHLKQSPAHLHTGGTHTVHKILTPDAIHVATALLHSCALKVTNDSAFRRIPDLPVAVLHELVS